MGDRVRRGSTELFVLLAGLLTVIGLLGGSAGQAIGPSPPQAAQVAVREGKVQANGITIAYESFGPDDREAVLMVMGNGAQLTAWPVELIEELVKRGYRVVIYDNRDVGLSTRFD